MYFIKVAHIGSYTVNMVYFATLYGLLIRFIETNYGESSNFCQLVAQLGKNCHY